MCSTSIEVTRAACWLVALALAACAQRPPDPTEPPTRPRPALPEPEPEPEPAPELVQVTVVSAELQGQMASGAPWDGGDESPNPLPQPLARYLEQHPELASDWLGITVEDEKLPAHAQASPAPDPMVVIELGDGPVFRSHAVPRSFTPLWDFSFRFLHGQMAEYSGVPRGATARIHVFDYDGPTRVEPIGTAVVPLDGLLSQPVATIGPFGGVTSLVLQTRTLPLPADPEAALIEQRVAVPGKGPWLDTGIVLQAGQRVLIRAADQVCTTSTLTSCSGPEGQRTPHPRFNRPGFSTVGHGALVAALGDVRFAVQRQIAFMAPASGRLLLGVNDQDTENNSGAYEAH
ncbi:MAG TPA: C2 domain-containing protein, partial [Haliangium sp.]|nr:C2 domain-containing protein [Haliangium sp.]